MSGIGAFLKRRWAAVLVASLVLNGFFIGMFATDYLKPHRRGGFSAERFANFELRRFDDRLPPRAVDQVAAELKPLTPEIEKRLQEVRDLRAEIMQLAAVPEPDRAALDSRLEKLRADVAAMQAEIQRATYDALLKLPPEDRARLAAAPDKG